ncbi:MAG: hypothetical protein GY800_09090 [Planctomycetes bacterium]|nr:hypothetical protein [Planctomycetota bacterium]
MAKIKLYRWPEEDGAGLDKDDKSPCSGCHFQAQIRECTDIDCENPPCIYKKGKPEPNIEFVEVENG